MNQDNVETHLAATHALASKLLLVKCVNPLLLLVRERLVLLLLLLAKFNLAAGRFLFTSQLVRK